MATLPWPRRGGETRACSPNCDFRTLVESALRAARMTSRTDSLILEVNDLVVDVLTGIYSEETGKPQPLRHLHRCALPASRIAMIPTRRWMRRRTTWTSNSRSSGGLPQGVHFKLIEAVADQISARPCSCRMPASRR